MEQRQQKPKRSLFSNKSTQSKHTVGKLKFETEKQFLSVTIEAKFVSTVWLTTTTQKHVSNRLHMESS